MTGVYLNICDLITSTTDYFKQKNVKFQQKEYMLQEITY